MVYRLVVDITCGKFTVSSKLNPRKGKNKMNLYVDVYEYDCEIGDYIDYEESVLHDAVEQHEKRYRTSVVALLAVNHRFSRYGAIGGNGAVGYRLIESNTDLLEFIRDDFEFEVNDNGELLLITGDHDGQNTIHFMPITESKRDKMYELFGELKYGFYGDYEKLESKLTSVLKAPSYMKKGEV